MRTIDCCGNEKLSFKTVITLGSFDGIHIGHQALFKTAIDIAKKKKIKTAVYTFKDHPLKKISPQNTKKRLMDPCEKEKMVKKWGFDYLILTEFTKKIQLMEPETFIKQVLVGQFNVKVVVVGENYRFGREGSGNIVTLKELGEKYCFSAVVVPPVMHDGKMVSSTRIRDLINNGHVKEASLLLGRRYALSGIVVNGYKRGRQMGFPTANLQIEQDRIVPKKGVYITKTKLEDGRVFKSVTSVSDNPTFGKNPLTVETHVIDFNEEIYGQPITISFVDWIREEKEFDAIDELIDQIHKDKAACLNNTD